MKKINKLNLVILLTASCFCAKAQTAITSGGHSTNNAGTYFTYTIGETIVPTFKKSENTLTQGFNQPSNLIVAGINNVNNAAYTINAYPNPSQDIVNIDITGDLSAPLMMEMYDNRGAKISPIVMQNDSKKISFNMQGLASGFYSVRLINPADHTSSTLKIVKIN